MHRIRIDLKGITLFACSPRSDTQSTVQVSYGKVKYGSTWICPETYDTHPWKLVASCKGHKNQTISVLLYIKAVDFAADQVSLAKHILPRCGESRPGPVVRLKRYNLLCIDSFVDTFLITTRLDSPNRTTCGSSQLQISTIFARAL